MNSKKIIFGITILIVLWFLLGKGVSESNLTSSIPTPIPIPTPAPPVAPKTFQFDSLTDLQAELEKVNPQIMDSDFE